MHYSTRHRTNTNFTVLHWLMDCTVLYPFSVACGDEDRYSFLVRQRREISWLSFSSVLAPTWKHTQKQWKTSVQVAVLGNRSRNLRNEVTFLCSRLIHVVTFWRADKYVHLSSKPWSLKMESKSIFCPVLLHIQAKLGKIPVDGTLLTGCNEVILHVLNFIK